MSSAPTTVSDTAINNPLDALALNDLLLLLNSIHHKCIRSPRLAYPLLLYEKQG